MLDGFRRRIENTDPQIRAWVALADDPRPRSGGRLAGIPFAVKDIIDLEGFKTRAGSRVLSEEPPRSKTALCLEPLIEEGVTILGKTNTHEFAYGYVTPPTVNPWDPERIPGGSSGGSAAAVASGMCLGAIGSDTGGSIRVPAALCGITGLKPSWGKIPTEGVIPLAPTMDVIGPMARTAEDVTLLWEILSGREVPEQDPRFSLGIPDPVLFGKDLEPSVEAAYTAAADLLGRWATFTGSPDIPNFEDFDVPRGALIMPEALRVHQTNGWWPQRAPLYSEEIASYLRFAESFLSPKLIEAGRQRARSLTDRFASAFDKFDVIIAPSVPCEAPTHQEAAETEEGSPRRPVAMKLGRLPSPVNMARLAALALPAGTGEKGMPVSIQLMSRHESLLLNLGKMFQRETDWHRRLPRVAV